MIIARVTFSSVFIFVYLYLYLSCNRTSTFIIVLRSQWNETEQAEDRRTDARFKNFIIRIPQSSSKYDLLAESCEISSIYDISKIKECSWKNILCNLIVKRHLEDTNIINHHDQMTYFRLEWNVFINNYMWYSVITVRYRHLSPLKIFYIAIAKTVSRISFTYIARHAECYTVQTNFTTVLSRVLDGCKSNEYPQAHFPSVNTIVKCIISRAYMRIIDSKVRFQNVAKCHSFFTPKNIFVI